MVILSSLDSQSMPMSIYLVRITRSLRRVALRRSAFSLPCSRIPVSRTNPRAAWLTSFVCLLRSARRRSRDAEARLWDQQVCCNTAAESARMHHCKNSGIHATSTFSSLGDAGARGQDTPGLISSVPDAQPLFDGIGNLNAPAPIPLLFDIARPARTNELAPVQTITHPPESNETAVPEALGNRLGTATPTLRNHGTVRHRQSAPVFLSCGRAAWCRSVVCCEIQAA
ncbi:hypothetical protein LZ30DRAFT_205169 [Colletotrichum cereale]|nr:hypothetical protein LZ30DRAFT_205169 [Colletotrichum cereale]